MTYKSALTLACAAVLATVAAREAAAQEAPAKPLFDKVGGAGYVMGGVRQLNLGPLHERLAQVGYSPLGQTFLSLGGGGHVMLGRLRLGGEGHALVGLGDDAARGTTRASVSGGYGLFRVGYAVIATERFSLYPMLGIGGGGVSLKTWEKGDADFDQVLADPRREATMTRGGLLLDAALGADYRIPFACKEKEEGFMLLGLRGSYTFSPSMGGWASSGGSVTGGPDLGIAGPSVHLLVGVGGIGATQ